MTTEEEWRGFAPDQQGLVERRVAVDRLAGQRIVRVEYVNIDYRGWDLGYTDQDVRRQIVHAVEWREPTWDATVFHHMDYGVELTTANADVWGITWDAPGPAGESIGLRPGRVIERGAVWDVTEREPWRSSTQAPVTGVSLRYHPWSDDFGGFCCTGVTLHFGAAAVEVLLGDRDTDGTLVPSADNVVVLVPPTQLPEWEQIDDLC